MDDSNNYSNNDILSDLNDYIKENAEQYIIEATNLKADSSKIETLISTLVDQNKKDTSISGFFKEGAKDRRKVYKQQTEQLDKIHSNLSVGLDTIYGDIAKDTNIGRSDFKYFIDNLDENKESFNRFYKSQIKANESNETSNKLLAKQVELQEKSNDEIEDQNMFMQDDFMDEIKKQKDNNLDDVVKDILSMKPDEKKKEKKDLKGLGGFLMGLTMMLLPHLDKIKDFMKDFFGNLPGYAKDAFNWVAKKLMAAFDGLAGIISDSILDFTGLNETSKKTKEAADANIKHQDKTWKDLNEATTAFLKAKKSGDVKGMAEAKKGIQKFETRAEGSKILLGMDTESEQEKYTIDRGVFKSDKNMLDVLHKETREYIDKFNDFNDINEARKWWTSKVGDMNLSSKEQSVAQDVFIDLTKKLQESKKETMALTDARVEQWSLSNKEAQGTELTKKERSRLSELVNINEKEDFDKADENIGKINPFSLLSKKDKSGANIDASMFAQKKIAPDIQNGKNKQKLNNQVLYNYNRNDKAQKDIQPGMTSNSVQNNVVNKKQDIVIHESTLIIGTFGERI